MPPKEIRNVPLPPKKKLARPAERVPVYITARQLSAVCARVVSRMPNNFRHTIGTLLLQRALALQEAILVVYRRFPQCTLPQKEAAIESIHIAADRVTTAIFCANDNNVVVNADFVEIDSHVVSIRKQLAGWIKSQRVRALAEDGPACAGQNGQNGGAESERAAPRCATSSDVTPSEGKGESQLGCPETGNPV